MSIVEYDSSGLILYISEWPRSDKWVNFNSIFNFLCKNERFHCSIKYLKLDKVPHPNTKCVVVSQKDFLSIIISYLFLNWFKMLCAIEIYHNISIPLQPQRWPYYNIQNCAFWDDDSMAELLNPIMKTDLTLLIFIRLMSMPYFHWINEVVHSWGKDEAELE